MRSMIRFTTIAAVPRGHATVDPWIASIRCQEHDNWEAILVEYGRGIGHVTCWTAGGTWPLQKDIRLSSSGNDALNLGLSMATGDVISLLPCDCEYQHPLVFDRVARCMEEPEVDLVCGDVACRRPSGGTVVSRPLALEGRRRDPAGRYLLPREECLFVRQDWWHFFGGLDTRYRQRAPLARVLDLMLQPDMQVRYLEEVLVRSVDTAGSMVALRPRRLLEGAWILARRGLLSSYVRSRSARVRDARDPGRRCRGADLASSLEAGPRCARPEGL